jgi:hypothetical protein
VFESADGVWLVHLWGLSPDAVRITRDHARRIAEELARA